MSVTARQLQTGMSLRELLSGFVSAPDIPVTGIASDSRQIEPGYLFLACQGIRSDGLDYVEEAIANGASAIAWEAPSDNIPPGIPVVNFAVEDLGRHLGEIANRYYGSPSSAIDVVGVTGTNGKTTVAWMISKCLQQLDKRCAYIGTLGYGLDLDQLHGVDGMTTPSTLELHGQLAGFVAQGATHAALEVSSHAISQGRIDGVHFDAVAFTNLSREHLDYHGDMQAYFETKAQLFLDCPARTKVINLDTEYGQRLANSCGQDVTTVSTRFDSVANRRPYVFVRSVVANATGAEVSFASTWGDSRFALSMVGDFNVANAVLALACLLQAGYSLADCCAALGKVAAPPGRMQRVAANGNAVYVDYAHTPDALRAALQALRPHCRGTLWCVFGCGGDRDAGKRPQMGAMAEKFADHTVVTNDNSRTEAPQKIVQEILGGMRQPRRATAIEDRAAAIAWAVQQATANDVILIAGKGHENYQLVAGKRMPFSDYAIAFAALEAKADRA
jgi:UDP-N-acetylmuramoyl-L-alanyl-D-glutamate--2,6-diaminopimelate ligase